MTLVPEHIKKLSPYIAGKTIESVKEKYGLEKIVKLASNENPIGPSPKSLKYVSELLTENHRYPDPSGYKLKLSLAEKFKLKVDNIILGNGSEGIMSTILRTFLKDNDEIISAKNSFIGFKVLANASGKKVNWVNMKNYHYDLEGIAEQINKNTKIIYLANPDNPTGTYFTINQFDKFMKNVPDRVLIILDEAYFEYAQFIKDYPDSMFYRYDNVITLRTFSKIYGLAGFRVGYGFAHEDLINNLLKVKLPFEPSISGQAAALGALNDENHLNKSINVNRVGFKKITNALNELKINYINTVTNFITFYFESKERAFECSSFLLERGIIVRNLSSFGLSECVRVTIGTDEENLFFIDGMKKFIGKY